MNELPLISIIVPVYNVESYLSECVNSLLRQTYQNTEIIIVDDGSSDHSGTLCDTFAAVENHITVVHQTNMGLSGARNTGIQLAKGEFLCFVDSDDYISDDCIDFLYNLTLQSDADIAIGGFITAFHHQAVDFAKDSGIPIRLSGVEAINEMLYSRKFSPSAWGKLFRKTLFEQIRFPDRKLYEDLFTTYKLLSKAQTIIFSDHKLYCYKKYAGTLSTQKNLQKQLDCMEALEQIYKDVVLKYPELAAAYKNCFLSFIMKLLSISNLHELKELKKYWTYVKQIRISVLHDKYALKRVRAFSCLSYSGMLFSKLILSIYYEKKWRL